MADKLFSRVIMRPGGDVHIAFWDKKSLECTPEVLLDFLSDPVAFFNAGRFKYYESTKTINPLK